MKRKILWLDTETTGVNEKENGIVQLSAIMEIDGVEVGEFDTLIKPHESCVIDVEALEVSGITREMIATAPEEREAYYKFTGWLAKHVDKFNRHDKAIMAGYNTPFDDRFLRELSARCGDKYLGSFKWPDLIDVRSHAIDALWDQRAKMENFQLGTVAKHLFSEEYLSKFQLHNSLDDIRLTRDVNVEVTNIIKNRFL